MKLFKFMLRKIPSGYSFFYLIWIQCCLRKKLICFLFYHCISETYLANIFFHPTMYGWDSLSSLYTRDIMEIWRDSLSHFWSAHCSTRWTWTSCVFVHIVNTKSTFDFALYHEPERKKVKEKVCKEFVYSQGQGAMLSE